MTAAVRSLRELDEVQHLRQLEAFSAEALVAAVGRDLALLGADSDELDLVRAVLVAIDPFIEKCMGIRLTHVLADSSVPAQIRTLLKATVLSYQGDLGLLRQRVAAAVARLDGSLTDRVMDAAERVLRLRIELHERLLELARDVAAARLPVAQAAARSRAHDLAGRQRWGQVRIDLEQIVASPAVLMSGTTAERLARIPAPPDEPDELPTRASLIELD